MADANEGLQRADPSACDAGQAINDRAKVSDDRKRRRKSENSQAKKPEQSHRCQAAERKWLPVQALGRPAALQRE